MKMFKKKPSVQQMADKPRRLVVKLSKCPKVEITEEGAEVYGLPEGQLGYLVNVERKQDSLPWIVILREQMTHIEVMYNPVGDTSNIVSPGIICHPMNEFEYSYIR